MKAYTHCRNRRCDDTFALYDRPVHGFCPSCWFMAKTSFGVGLVVVSGLAFLAGVAKAWLL